MKARFIMDSATAEYFRLVELISTYTIEGYGPEYIADRFGLNVKAVRELVGRIASPAPSGGAS